MIMKEKANRDEKVAMISEIKRGILVKQTKTFMHTEAFSKAVSEDSAQKANSNKQ